MPYIETKVNVKITKEQEENLKERLGKLIEIFPGKSEKWLMLNFEDECRLYMSGNGDLPTAYVEVKIFGTPEAKAAEKMTHEICLLLEDVLGIDPSRTYVKYEDCNMWGWNKSNF